MGTLNKPRAGWAVRLATLGPVGLLPVAPGTAASIVGVILVMFLRPLPLEWRGFYGAVAVAAALVFALGVWAAGKAETFYGVTDPGQAVIDEVAGQLVVFLLCPKVTWLALLAGLALFRVFDVLKPFPARRAERLPGGWGIMTDDLVAGAYGATVLFLLGIGIR
jgi:phosphatidylglycerophosphatase A